MPCADLASNDAEGYDYLYRCGVPEYLVYLIAAELGSFSALRRWGRPCAICRRGFKADHHASLQFELWRLCEALAARSKNARDALESAQGDINPVFAVIDDLARFVDDARVSRPAIQGYVYAISDGDAVKIGWSSAHPGRPGGRLAQFQTGQPRDLRLLGAVLGERSDEHALHERFAEHRIRGEWFRCVPEIVEYFDKP